MARLFPKARRGTYVIAVRRRVRARIARYAQLREGLASAAAARPIMIGFGAAWRADDGQAPCCLSGQPNNRRGVDPARWATSANQPCSVMTAHICRPKAR